MERKILEVLEKFKKNDHIFNLSHGILPSTQIKNLEKLIKLVRNYDFTKWSSKNSRKKEKINMEFNSKLVDFEVTLIRAPKIIGKGNEIQVLLELDDSPIAIYNGMHMGLSFHPELNGVTLFHDSLFRGLVNSNFQAPGNINAA